MGVHSIGGCFFPLTCTCGGGSRCVEIMGPGEVAIFDEGICVRFAAGWFGQDRGV